MVCNSKSHGARGSEDIAELKCPALGLLSSACGTVSFRLKSVVVATLFICMQGFDQGFS